MLSVLLLAAGRQGYSRAIQRHHQALWHENAPGPADGGENLVRQKALVISHITHTYAPPPTPRIMPSHSSAPSGHGTGVSGLGGSTGQQLLQCGSGMAASSRGAGRGGRA